MALAASDIAAGPYLPAVLRFNISFPSRYPDLPPLVTFVSEIFHPLLVPLTTYTFSSGASDAYETVSASDEERLPPGGFSLRHGFPQWFGRKSRGPQGVMSVDTWHSHNGHQLKAESTDVSAEPVPESLLDGTGTPYQTSHEAAAEHASIVEVLNYLKSAFQDPMMLDELPLEAAADPGAWHAWRSHRGFSKGPRNAINSANDERSQSLVADLQIQPNDWNWEGVWKNRVKIGIENSLSDPVLHGPKGGRGGDKRTELVSGTETGMSPVTDSYRYDSPR